MKSWSLRRRLLIRLALIIGFFWIATSTLATFIIYGEMSEVLDSSLEETAQRIAPLAKSLKFSLDNNENDQGRDETEKYEHEEYVSYQIQDKGGRLLFRSHEAPKTAWLIGSDGGFSDRDGWRFYTILIENSELIVQVGENLEHRFIAISEATLVMIAPILLLLPILFLVFRHVLNRSFLPVTIFNREIEDRGSGNLSDVSSTNLPVELDPIRDQLNSLLARVRATLAAERSFSSNSAHQLRTPVAAALAQSEMLERELDIAPQRERVKKLSEALRRLSRIVEKLLQLARADAAQMSQHDQVDISEIISILVMDCRRLHPERDIHISGLERPVYALGDPDALAIMFQNLIENAALYATPDTTIEIELTHDGFLRVTNDCPAITPELFTQLGERFVRGAYDMRGTGLGLAIIQSLARQSGLDFEIYSPIRGQVRGFEAELKLRLKI